MIPAHAEAGKSIRSAVEKNNNVIVSETVLIEIN